MDSMVQGGTYRGLTNAFTNHFETLFKPDYKTSYNPPVGGKVGVSRVSSSKSARR